ncbi:hypothetical protein MTR67_022388 [Solanum verrucosum]|uniref:Uncharacterized protein n=1 Tax=Solanum verrucosum TaxID=315347 RepID=A0AAF0TXT8_SOLVR|nr:hypothetical protein MTR67_022388 [Solanum verrucosum]
MRGRRGRGIHH